MSCLSFLLKAECQALPAQMYAGFSTKRCIGLQLNWFWLEMKLMRISTVQAFKLAYLALYYKALSGTSKVCHCK